MRTVYLLSMVPMLAACADVRSSQDARNAVHSDLESQITASEPHCVTDQACKVAWESVKKWAQYYPSRVVYFANATRVTMTSSAGEFGLDIYLRPDAGGRVIHVEKTCSMWRPCFNAAASAILEMNSAVAKSLESAGSNLNGMSQ